MEARKKDSPRQNRTQRRLRQTRRKLTEAAGVLFAQKGVEATTIQDITEHADLGKGTFYRHFSSKEEVMLALIQHSVSRLTERIRSVTTPTPPSIEQAMDAVLRAHLVFAKESRDDFVLLFQGRLYVKLQRDGATDLEPPFADYLAELERVVKAFLPGVSSPRVRRLACALIGFASGSLAFLVLGMGGANLENHFQPLERLFIGGIAAFLKDGGDRIGASVA